MCEKRYKDHRGVRAHLKKFHKIVNPNTKNLMDKDKEIEESCDDNQINMVKLEGFEDNTEIIEVNYEEIIC
jgi:hypothetical protein